VRIFHDAEFLENGRTIDLISLGLVREDGTQMYAVNDQLLRPATPSPHSLYERVTQHDWLMDNVVPHLPLKAPERMKPHGRHSGGGGWFYLNPESHFVLPLRLIRSQVRDFVLATPEPELWAWYGAYDHVVLAQLFGRMIDLPRGFPMWTNDIRTLAMLAGPQARANEPKQVSGEHDALADARFNQVRYDYYAPQVDVRRLA
jgi:hypothetical protein